MSWDLLLDKLLDWAKLILEFIGPVIMLTVTARIEDRRRKEDATKKEEQEAIDKKFRELLELMEKVGTDVGNLKGEMDSIKSTITTMQKFDQEVKDDISSLADQNESSIMYTHEMAKVLTVLASGIRDHHLDGNITAALESFRSYEERRLSLYMSHPHLHRSE